MTHSEDNTQDDSLPLEEGKRKLATIMFSDICGYTRMMSKNEAKTLQLVKKNLEIHQELIEKHNGTLIKEMGDGLLASFESPSDAVRCAKEILRLASLEEELELHIGIHQGEVIFTDNDVYGEGVNITARIDSEAWPGEILISEDVWKNIRNKDEFVAISIGKKQMKNVADPMELFRILITEEDNSEKYQQFLRRRKAPILKFGLMVVAGLIILAAAFLWYDSYNNAPLEDYKSIAILPFQNKTNNKDFDYLSEGLADDVIKQFSHLSELSVISSRSSFKFKDTDKTIGELSKLLKADLIMDGSYSIDGDKLLVKIELIGGRTNEIICYASPIANMDKVKRISAAIEREVYKALKIPVGGEEKTRKHDTRNVNIEAYKYYVLGKNAMRDNSLQDIEEIIKFFKTAIQLDSTYADPYIGIAEAYFFDVSRGYLSPAEASANARGYALKAEELNPGSGEVLGILGGLYYFDYRFDEAIQYFEKAISVDPNYVFAYQYYAYTLFINGQFDQAINIMEKAVILDPMNLFFNNYIVMSSVFQRDYDGAIKYLQQELLIKPESKHLLFWLGIVYMEKEDFQSAYDTFLKRGVGLKSNFAAGYTYVMLGMEEEADEVLQNVLKNSKLHYVPPAQLAILYVGMGNYEKALDYVEQAYIVRDAWMGWIKYSGLLDPIRDEPRFVKVMEMMNSYKP